jgi:hypothetical protein
MDDGEMMADGSEADFEVLVCFFALQNLRNFVHFQCKFD